ncbi:MAG: peptide chain release factor N(5)-glutamine methyltransferase [Lachnospiraceae bacterium]|nr:peptide chain release factor N(5)-glutamine methyltransferase [Lachnospiraceae bacterium]
MTFREALKAGEEYLREQKIEDARVDAWYLLEHCCQISRAHYLMKQTELMPDSQYSRYQLLLMERGRHVPLQHITGEQEFMGLPFRVNDQVLIPRQDTEILVEQAAQVLTPGQKVLDLCTGSGCIGISLAKMVPDLYVVASDVSPAALETARDNALRLDAQVHFIESNLFEKIQGTFDLIVSNPPYIPTAAIPKLMAEVQFHEPRSALDGRKDGLHFYREIIRESDFYLKRGGWLMFEIGFDQGEAVSAMMHEKEYTKVKIIKDLAGLDRVVTGRRI